MKIVRIYQNDKNARIEITNEGFSVNKNKNFGGSFYYTIKYIQKNKEVLKELFNNKVFENLSYKDEESYLLTNDIIKAKNYFFSFNYSLSVFALDLLLRNKDMKKLFAFYIPMDYIEEFENSGVEVIINNSFEFNNDFIKYNQIDDLTDIYYMQEANYYSRESIIESFERLIKISRSLMVVNMYYYSKETLEYILRVLRTNKIYGVNIFVHVNEDNFALVNKDTKYMSRLNAKSNNKIQILYEKDTLKNKIFKTMTFNITRLITIIFIYTSVALMLSKPYHEYASALEMRVLESKLNDILKEEKPKENIEDLLEEDPNGAEEQVQTKEEPYSNIPQAFDVLKTINSDVNSWITVNNTRVNYPVVKSDNNSYYLDHDIYKNYAFSGWIFMDYRSKEDYSSKNTIIYGHSMKNGLMLGTLYQTTYYSWYSNKDNQIITINTPDGYYKYQIFSIYRIEATSDYLDVDFVSDDSFLSFANFLKSRSIHDFGVNLKKEDKIITLSTCSDNNMRLVIHAVKI